MSRGGVTFVGLGLALLAGLGSAGCGGSSQDASPVAAPGSYQHLKRLGMAYIAAEGELGRPPQNAEELLGFIKHKDPQSFLRTPQGEPYVILWGSPIGDDHTSYVIAYEPKETSGRRYVLIGRDVSQMTTDELRNAKFAPGKQPPL